jgi:hypothetical protein
MKKTETDPYCDSPVVALVESLSGEWSNIGNYWCFSFFFMLAYKQLLEQEALEVVTVQNLSTPAGLSNHS